MYCLRLASASSSWLDPGLVRFLASGALKHDLAASSPEAISHFSISGLICARLGQCCSLFQSSTSMRVCCRSLVIGVFLYSSLTFSKFLDATVAEMRRRKRRSSGHPGTWKVV